jgi:hypothetical protein
LLKKVGVNFLPAGKNAQHCMTLFVAPASQGMTLAPFANSTLQHHPVVCGRPPEDRGAGGANPESQPSFVPTFKLEPGREDPPQGRENSTAASGGFDGSMSKPTRRAACLRAASERGIKFNVECLLNCTALEAPGRVDARPEQVKLPD